MTKQWEISEQTKWPKFIFKITKNDKISDQKMRDMKLGIKKDATRGTNDEAKHGANDEAKHGVDMVAK